MSRLDFIIVGAGASGAAVAWSLVSRGYKVLCLDRGPRMDPSHYPSTGHDWEIRKRTEFNPVTAERQNRFDYPIDDSRSPIAVCNFNAVGGSTILYSGHFPRFLEADFALNSREGVGADWPFGYGELAPYFTLNERMMGLSGLAGDPYYPQIEKTLPPVPLGSGGERLAKAFNAKGWHWWPSFSAILTRPRGERGACLNLGPCNTGCPQGAKASADNTYLKEALRLGLMLVPEFAVSRVLVRDGKAYGVEGFDDAGEGRVFEADHVILTSSAIGTARILLNSRTDERPQGLGNTSGQVGRNLMIHPLGYVEGIFDQRFDTDSGPQGCMLYSLQFHRTPGADHRLGYMMQALRGTGPVETALSALARRKLRFGTQVYDDFDAFYAKQLVIAIVCEDLPRTENRVELDETRHDRFGDPGVKIHYVLHDNTKKMMIHGMSRARELMAAAGAIRSSAYGPVRNTGWHLLGTARMGDDSRNSVVDAQGRVYDTANLYVADSSVFVTASCVNPANTIQAVALMLADRIDKHVRSTRS
ncbi:GMC family oxidoreductase [Gluconacetobacter diazotrophicus]|uniref:Putative flavoproteins oxidoreductases n=1 Tax=Gluconacetobacter diazotrophicus (strain ATCC 49037 / DSM 5601 / CCUG 37298 / CIP 103539 / LMG 7603 / PAl5) TaxID=272568 RepID=A9HRN4_GLUDA|nr:GMC family oxidoreductase [Gluconacetobacter diazotrophicus]CAP56948.1 putative flavoproteins oxidoreductases [Gluconacetobacter diazotrophicus PA1 5]